MMNGRLPIREIGAKSFTGSYGIDFSRNGAADCDDTVVMKMV